MVDILGGADNQVRVGGSSFVLIVTKEDAVHLRGKDGGQDEDYHGGWDAHHLALLTRKSILEAGEK